MITTTHPLPLTYEILEFIREWSIRWYLRWVTMNHTLELIEWILPDTLWVREFPQCQLVLGTRGQTKVNSTLPPTIVMPKLHTSDLSSYLAGVSFVSCGGLILSGCNRGVWPWVIGGVACTYS